MESESINEPEKCVVKAEWGESQNCELIPFEIECPPEIPKTIPIEPCPPNYYDIITNGFDMANGTRPVNYYFYPDFQEFQSQCHQPPPEHFANVLVLEEDESFSSIPKESTSPRDENINKECWPNHADALISGFDGDAGSYNLEPFSEPFSIHNQESNAVKADKSPNLDQDMSVMMNDENEVNPEERPGESSVEGNDEGSGCNSFLEGVNGNGFKYLQFPIEIQPEFPNGSHFHPFPNQEMGSGDVALNKPWNNGWKPVIQSTGAIGSFLYSNSTGPGVDFKQERAYREEMAKVQAEERARRRDELFLMKCQQNCAYQDSPNMRRTDDGTWNMNEPTQLTKGNCYKSYNLSSYLKKIYTEMQDKNNMNMPSKHLKDVLPNIPKSKNFLIDPPYIEFCNKIGEKCSRTLTLVNKGKLKRRYAILQPFDNCFDVKYGKVIGQPTALTFGLMAKIHLEFKPKKKLAKDFFLIILVEGDGGIILPIHVKSEQSFSILIADELDCGSSLIKNPEIITFEYINVGETGRFWILSEEEFLGGMDSGKCDLNGNELLREVKWNPTSISNILIDPPFQISPSCFKLQRGEKIQIEASFTPTEKASYCKKLAFLCDNAEVRWIQIKGIGLEK